MVRLAMPACNNLQGILAKPNQNSFFKDAKMEPILIAIVIVLIIFVLGLLVWLITSHFANRRDLAGQAAGISMLQQQLEALKTIGNNYHHLLNLLLCFYLVRCSLAPLSNKTQD